MHVEEDIAGGVAMLVEPVETPAVAGLLAVREGRPHRRAGHRCVLAVVECGEIGTLLRGALQRLEAERLIWQIRSLNDEIMLGPAEDITETSIVTLGSVADDREVIALRA